MAAEPLATPVSMRSGRVWVWSSIVGVVSVLAWIGHRLAFAQFQEYDDEGYLLLTVRQFLEGYRLFDDVYTQYGPAYYLWQQFLHGVIGIPVTHDATRVVTVCVWLACSLLAGVPVWLLTKRLLLTAIGTAIAFFHLTQLTFEPGHPQELCLLAVLGAVAIAMWRFTTAASLGISAAAAIGSLVAITALTKINVGGFLAGALALGLVTSLRYYSWRRALSAVTMLSALVAVLGLMYRDLFRHDIVAWVVVVWSGLLAVFLVGYDRSRAAGVATAAELIACAVAATIVATAAAAAVIAQGTSPRALFEGLFVWPLRHPDVFWRPLPVAMPAAALALVWLGVAVSWRGASAFVRRLMPALALVAGMLAFLLSITKTYGLLLALTPPVAWLLLGGVSVPAGERAARRILAFAAILMALQTYPMPEGTQIVLGTLLFVPVGFVTLGDAQRELRARERKPAAPPSFARRATFAALGVIVVAATGVRVQRLYADGVPLRMPGAEGVRVAARDSAAYWWLATNLREHCDGFLTAPGLNSLHFWTGIPPVSTLNATLWPILFDDAQQRRIVEAAARVRRLCAAWNRPRMDALMRTEGTSSRPLVAWLAREFEPQAAFGGWELRVRRGRGPVALYQARWSDDDRILIELPPLGDEPVARIAIVDVDANRVLGDSMLGPPVIVNGEDGAPVHVDGGIDVSRRRRIALRGAGSLPSARASVVVRLWTSGGQEVTAVPVVRDASALDSR
jgi:hypothetical protein